MQHIKWRKLTDRRRAAKRKAGQAGAAKRWRLDPTLYGDSAAQSSLEETEAGPTGLLPGTSTKTINIFPSQKTFPNLIVK